MVLTNHLCSLLHKINECVPRDVKENVHTPVIPLKSAKASRVRVPTLANLPGTRTPFGDQFIVVRCPAPQSAIGVSTTSQNFIRKGTEPCLSHEIHFRPKKHAQLHRDELRHPRFGHHSWTPDIPPICAWHLCGVSARFLMEAHSMP